MSVIDQPSLSAFAVPAKSGTAAPVGDALKRAQIRETAQKFEASFLSAMLMPMFQDVDAGAFGGGQAEDMVKSFMAEAMGKQIAKSGGVGLAPSVAREMLKMQGLTETPQ